VKTLLIALAVVVSFGLNAHGQQNFSQTQLKQLNNRNSASAFTSQRVMSGVLNRSIPQYNFSTVNRGLLKGAMGSSTTMRQKPFSQVQRGPSVSPYLGLVSDNPFTSTTTNYFNNVRPQLEQQKMNEKLQMQNIKMQRQLEEIAARPPYDVTGSEERAPTGHAAVYQNQGGVYGNPGGYYPQVPIKSVRGQKQ
jgi:hypothetical protein